MPALSKSAPSILAIAPGARYLGFAFFAGGELVRFGVRSFPGKKTKANLLTQALGLLDTLSRRHHPAVLVVEDLFYREASQSALLRHLVPALKKWGKEQKLKTIAYLPSDVKAHFCAGRKKTRAALAAAMVARYWFLYSYLKPGRTQHYWRQMFDAVALGTLACEAHLRTSKVRST
jgi:Holliday junction resolvasome RuvABC endonuclease subunit